MNDTLKNILLVLGVVFFLCPPMWCKYRLVERLWIFVLMVYNGILIYGAIYFYTLQKVFTGMPTLLEVSYIVHMSYLCIINVLITIKLFSKKTDITGLMRTLKFIYEHNKNMASQSNSFYKLIAIWSVLMMIRLIRTYYYYLRYEPRHIPISIHFDILAFRTEAAIFLSWLLIWEAKRQFKLLNDELKNATDIFFFSDIKSMHNAVCNLVGAINEVFGAIIACGVFGCIISFLHAAVALLYYDGTGDDESWFTVTFLMYFSYFTMNIVGLALIGEQLKDESERTVDICYNHSQEINHIGDRTKINNQFLQIAQQAFQRDTKIIAAGFFPIDHSLILFTVTNICCYLIVVCQFK